MSQQPFIILGAHDKEMVTIAEYANHLYLRGVISGFGYATVDFERCVPVTAYKANRIDVRAGQCYCGAPQVAVECHLADESVRSADYTVIDHHKPGDFGWDLPAEKSVEASSLGQLVTRFGNADALPANWRAIAAADHNLAAAYSGIVPGIKAEDVLPLRVAELAQRMRLTEPEVSEGIMTAMRQLKLAATIEIDGHLVADIRGLGVNAYFPDAANALNINAIGFDDIRDVSKIKLVGNATLIAYFLENDILGISNKYGNPSRGFAGGKV